MQVKLALKHWLKKIYKQEWVKKSLEYKKAQMHNK